MSTHYYLAETICSNWHRQVIYGHCGEKVKHIATYDQIIIVEGKSGRFPAPISKLTPIENNEI